MLHNPTGYSLSAASAHRMLQLAQQRDFHIVEDDTYHHLAPEHATRLAQLDGLARTIYVSGFAKILAPAWRVGFLAAPPDLVEPLMDTKLLATLTTPLAPTAMKGRVRLSSPLSTVMSLPRAERI